MPVSLTMIVRDEAENLPRCLGSCAGLFDEMVVVDTGSTDDTREIAGSFGAKIFDFPWCDDFSAARNHSLQHATGDWLFWLDADNYLDDENRQRMRTLLDELKEPCVYEFAVADFYGQEQFAVQKRAHLFHRSLGLRWTRRVHEMLVPVRESRRTHVCITHVGYLNPVSVAAKDRRNLRLMQMELEERPDDPLVLNSLGSLALRLGDTEQAVRYFLRCLESPACGQWRGLKEKVQSRLEDLRRSGSGR